MLSIYEKRWLIYCLEMYILKNPYFVLYLKHPTSDRKIPNYFDIMLEDDSISNPFHKIVLSHNAHPFDADSNWFQWSIACSIDGRPGVSIHGEWLMSNKKAILSLIQRIKEIS